MLQLVNMSIGKIIEGEKILFSLVILIVSSIDLHGQISGTDSFSQQKQIPIKDSSITITSIDNKIVAFPKKKITTDTGKRDVELHGTIFIEAQYASNNYSYQQVPQSYLRTTVSPQLSLWGIPFTSQVNLSTEQLKVNYNLNRLNLSLDVNKLNALLLNRLKEKSKDSLNYEKLNTQFLEDTLQALSVVDSALERAKRISDSKRDQLQQLENKFPKKPTIEYDSLLANDMRYRIAYKNYLVKQNEYKKSIATRDSLEKLKIQYDKLKNKYDKLKSSGTFDIIKINAANTLPSKYKTHPLFSRTDKLLLSVRSFSIGTLNQPSSQSYMQGTAINGISIENEFGKVYTSLQAGLMQQNLSFGNTQQNPSKKYLYSLKAGWGMPENAHLHLGYTKSGVLGGFSRGLESEITLQVPDNVSIVSADAKLPLTQNMYLFGNWALSNVSGFGIESIQNGENVSNSSLQTSGTNNFLSLPNTFYTGGVRGEFTETKTRFEGQITRIGTSFQSPLNPYLRNDQLRRDIRVNQKVYKQYISAGINYSNSEDNLSGQKKSTTTINNYKASLSIRLKKLPSLIISYGIINQNIANEESSILNYANKTEVSTITSVYTRRLKAYLLTGAITFMHQNVSNNYSQSFSRQYSSLSGNISISDLPGNTITYTSTYSKVSSFYNTVVFNHQAEFTIIYPKRPLFTSTAGVFYSTDTNLGNNGGVFVRQSASLWKNSSIALLCRQNFFSSHYPRSKTIHQTIINLQLLQQW